jgi:hypothetical protein
VTEVNWLTDLFWSIDPGETKCGVAVYRDGRCQLALRSTPTECLDKLWEHLGLDPLSEDWHATAPRAVVVERFALRADLAAMQKGSEMGTSQMIGAIRWMCHNRRVPVVMQTPYQAHAIERQQPFAAWPQRRFVSYGEGRDAKMAELHGLFKISTSLTAKQRRSWHESMD